MPDVPPSVRLAVEKAAEAAFFRITSQLAPIGDEYAVEADICERELALGASPTWFNVRFLLPRTFPDDVAHCVPLDPCLRWSQHQNGDWADDPHANVMCPPSLAQLSRDEFLQPYITHAHEWIRDALSGTLITPEQRYEFPHICAASLQGRCVYVEGGRSVFAFVQKHSKGLAQVWKRKAGGVLRVESLTPTRGPRRTSELQVDPFGVEEFAGWAPWVFAGRPVVKAPHQPPLGLGDLPCPVQERVLKAVDHAARQNAYVDVLLLAFGVPSTWGGDAEGVVWQAVQLDDLRAEELTWQRGFRKQKPLTWPGVQRFLSRHERLRYVKTREVSPEALHARNSEDNPMRGARIAMLGVGSLGSLIARSMGKLAPRSLKLVDNEVVEPGNLVRHEAPACAVEVPKTKAMKAVIAPIEAWTQVEAVTADIVSEWPSVRPLQANLIIDSSANEGVHRLVFGDGRLGLRALCFISPGPDFGVLLLCPRGQTYDTRKVHSLVKEVLTPEDWALYSRRETVAPYAGCHHPTFPASYHRLRIMADTMLTAIVAASRNDIDTSWLAVIAQRERALGIESRFLHQGPC